MWDSMWKQYLYLQAKHPLKLLKAIIYDLAQRFHHLTIQIQSNYLKIKGHLVPSELPGKRRNGRRTWHMIVHTYMTHAYQPSKCNEHSLIKLTNPDVPCTMIHAPYTSTNNMKKNNITYIMVQHNSKLQLKANIPNQCLRLHEA